MSILLVCVLVECILQEINEFPPSYQICLSFMFLMVSLSIALSIVVMFKKKKELAFGLLNFFLLFSYFQFLDLYSNCYLSSAYFGFILLSFFYFLKMKLRLLIFLSFFSNICHPYYQFPFSPAVAT